MAALTPLKITLLARVGDSPVLNEIGTVELEGVVRPVDRERESDSNAAAEARYVVEGFDLPTILRGLADDIEGRPERTAVRDALAARDADRAARKS